MLSPEPRLDMLLEELGKLPGADRRAIIARLTPRERERIRARLSGWGDVRQASPYSADIAARIADPEGAAVTVAGRAALADALRASGEESAAVIEARSLASALAGWFRRWGIPL
ncbi:hypothetical protein [Sphingomonas sp.]|uniref:hypothetical protein n=1 Tax=Sphingomonas sp. TaxID=28214 RepID=UPI001B125C0E|nr:hypothetical protein [Sphingomonas sp.]MBO9714798.1 hypothetical protein [Sphingomonas sp.]